MSHLGIALISFVALTIPAGCASNAQAASGRLVNPPPAKTSLAINLSGAADWSTEIPFVDLMRFSRPWVSQEEGKPWGQGPKLELDAQGWVKRLPDRVFAETFLTSFETHYPAGDYVALYEGEGEIVFGGNAQVIQQRPGRMVVRVDPKRGFLTLQLRRTNPAKPVRNLRVIAPGFEATYAKNPFHPAFLARWKGVSAIRFMDWMSTNNSPVTKWTDRPRVEDATWATPKGIPLEIMADLANRLQVDAWFCMPHRADDDYVSNFARETKRLLSPNLRAYVEYSNEVWNGQFEQSRYAGERGMALKIGEKPWEAAWHYTARRSKEIFKVWEREFGPKPRLVRVLASQAGNPYVSEQILKFDNAGASADALSIAPYFGLNVGPESKPNVSTVSRWSLDELFGHIDRVVLPEAQGYITGNKKVADQYRLPLIAYEAGQHLVGIQGGENDEALTKLLHAANRDPRMGAAYDRYLTGWRQAGGGLLAAFSSVSSWSKWGSWGAMEYYDEDPAKSPKMASLLKWARSQGQSIGARP